MLHGVICMIVSPCIFLLLDCGEPASKANAALSSGGNLEGDTRTYSCQAGYEAAAGSDTGDVTCQSNGAWSTSTLTCEVGRSLIVLN